MNEVTMRLLGLAIQEPDYVIPKANAAGLRAGDFGSHKAQMVWGELQSMRGSGISIDEVTTKNRLEDKHLVDVLISQASAGEVDVPTYSQLIIEKAIEREVDKAARKARGTENVQSALVDLQSKVDKLQARYSRMQNPSIQNPADVLSQSKGWSTRTGLSFIDRLVRLTSGGIHFLAGDPGSGKTTAAIHALAYNARNSVNAVGILAESSQLEVSLGMLTQTKAISAYEASQLRFNAEYRTKERVDRVRSLWDEQFGSLPLSIMSVEEGPSAAVSLINSVTQPSFIAVDHAFAIVSQGRVSEEVRDHQSFMRFFSAVKTAAERNGHVVLMLNQYTKAGRAGETRGPDAEYGGSGVQNIATTMIHCMKPASEIDTMAGYRKMLGIIPKCRAMLVTDEDNNPIDPVQVTDSVPFSYWINTKYRLIVDQLPYGD